MRNDSRIQWRQLYEYSIDKLVPVPSEQVVMVVQRRQEQKLIPPSNICVTEEAKSLGDVLWVSLNKDIE